MIPILLATMTAFLPLQDTPEKRSPWSGHFWKFKNADGKTAEISVSSSMETVLFRGKQVRVHPATWMGSKAYVLVQQGTGDTWILGKKAMGKPGQKMFVALLYVFQWQGERGPMRPSTWGYKSEEGCGKYTAIFCKSEGPETVSGVECTKFRIGKESWVISRENGVFRMSRRDGTWKLEARGKISDR